MTMQTREIQFGDHHYPFHFGVDCSSEIVEHILSIDVDKYVLIVDANVEELHAAKLVELLRRKAQVVTITLTASERLKSLEIVGNTLESAFAQGMTRRSCVLAMGGGVVGNMAGLVAGLAFRGIRLIHLPTTLIAALDSVLSLKQAVNGKLGKNLIGCFHTPVSVLVDLTWLTTLPVREMRAGLCELIKNALAIAPETRPTLEKVLRKDCRLSALELLSLVDIAIDAKVQVMKDDAREKGGGLALEYGHTIGHALELAAPGLLSHGEAVGVGMLCAADIAARVYALPQTSVDAHHALLEAIGITRELAHSIPTDTVMKLLMFDNKRGYLRPDSDQIPMILLDRVGELRRTGTTPLTAVPASEVRHTLAARTERPRAHRTRGISGITLPAAE
jgi:3-dehydroquinate synthase/2-deoxy-scyllo-inosose synthase